jgi:hypothetical protein
MAATAASLRQMLERMGFSAASATFIVADQGMDDANEFAIMSDEDVVTLCKTARRPGGTIPNPVAGADAPTLIANPGFGVTARAERNLKLCCFYLRFLQNTSRVVTIGEVTLTRVRKLTRLKDWVENVKKPDRPTVNDKDWPHTLESFVEFLRGCPGEKGVPLARVVRKETLVPVSNIDPPENYKTLQDELITHPTCRWNFRPRLPCGQHVSLRRSA